MAALQSSVNMANIVIKNVSIRGISACAPSHVEDNMGIPVFNEGEAERVIAQTGIRQKHTVPDGSVLASDLCVAACERLLAELHWERDSCLVSCLCPMTIRSLRRPASFRTGLGFQRIVCR